MLFQCRLAVTFQKLPSEIKKISMADYQMLCAYAALEPLPTAKQDFSQAAIVQAICSIFNSGLKFEDFLPEWALIGVDLSPVPKTPEEQRECAIKTIMGLSGKSYAEVKQKFDEADAKRKLTEE